MHIKYLKKSKIFFGLLTVLFSHTANTNCDDSRDSAFLFAQENFERLENLKTAPTTKRSVVDVKTVEELKTHYLKYSPTDESLNQEWIDFAANYEKGTYFLIENAAMKRLNSKMDTDVVTALTNLHKDYIMAELQEVLYKYPDIKLYSDYKAVGIAIPKNLEEAALAEIEMAISKAGLKYEEHVKSLNIKAIKDEAANGWFNTGIGKTADEAELAANKARERVRIAGRSFPYIVRFDDVQPLFEMDLKNLDDMRLNIRRQLQKTQGAYKLSSDINDPKKFLLKKEVFELLRKDRNTLAQSIRKIYGVEISKDLEKLIIEYFDKVDKFSPKLRNAKREYASLEDAVNGGLSADFLGMGASNIYQVAKDIAWRRSSEDLAQLAKRVRAGEKAVTKEFLRRKNKFTQHALSFFEKIGKKANVACSGDDCIAILTSKLTPHERRLFMKEWAKTGELDWLRLSFIPENIDKSVRTSLAKVGENLEKLLRKKVTGSGGIKIPPEKMKDVTFAFEMPGNFKDGEINLIVAIKDESTLSYKDKELIRSVFDSLINSSANDLEIDFKASFKSGAIDYMAP